MSVVKLRDCTYCGQEFTSAQRYCSTECWEADTDWAGGIAYDICCRECDHQEEVYLHLREALPACAKCGSPDVFRAITKAPPVELRQQAGGVGWELNGYHNDGAKHYDLDKMGGGSDADILRSAAKDTTHGGNDAGSTEFRGVKRARHEKGIK